LSVSLCLIIMLTCRRLSAQNEHRIRKYYSGARAWADGSGGKAFTTFLLRMATTSASSRSRTSFKDDVVHEARTSLQMDRAFLSLTAWGAVITEAGTDHPSRFGDIAAHMPDAGEMKLTTEKRFPSDLAKSGAIKKTADGSLPGPRAFHEYFAATCLLSKPLHARCSAQFCRHFKQSLPRLRGGGKPSWMW